MTNEVRTTDEDTGAQKGVKLERFDLIPVGPLTELARHYGMGAAKYADRNWERGYNWDKSYQAGMRHATQFWSGEDLDPDPFYDQFPEEVRPKHVIAAAWHFFALAQFMDQHPEKDNRPRPLRVGETRTEGGLIVRQDYKQHQGMLVPNFDVQVAVPHGFIDRAQAEQAYKQRQSQAQQASGYSGL